jgi:hypothetical protein
MHIPEFPNTQREQKYFYLPPAATGPKISRRKFVHRNDRYMLLACPIAAELSLLILD